MKNGSSVAFKIRAQEARPDMVVMPSDPLIERVKAGDRAAFAELIEKYQRLVAMIVGRMTGNREDREEICQDVFLKVFAAIGAYRQEASFSSWIGRIAYNETLNRLRRRRLIAFSDLGDGEAAERWAGGDPTPEAVLLETDLKQRLEAEMAALDPRYRVILTLFHVAGMSYDEIGRILELPEGTVKSHLFRARRQLRERLASPDRKGARA
jgi:RNA polymerase sigma-70 factor (ECF subfamily)